VQARVEAQAWAAFQMILGCADRSGEAWVLCGLEPETDEERARLGDLRGDLGFEPISRRPGWLRPMSSQECAKRVLRLLTGNDRERERRFWTESRSRYCASAVALRVFATTSTTSSATLVPLVRSRLRASRRAA
jgi:hypothetical protein